MVWALLESVNGIEAQPARVDAAVINNATPRIRAAFAFSAIGIPNSRNRNHSTTLYATESLEVNHRRRDSVLDPAAHTPNVRNETAGVELPPAV